MFSYLQMSKIQDYDELNQNLLLSNLEDTYNNNDNQNINIHSENKSLNNSDSENDSLNNSLKDSDNDSDDNNYNKNQSIINLGSINQPQISNIFLKNIYEYYYAKGYKPIIIDKITHLMINYFLIFFVNFMTNCIDYKAILVDFKSGDYISDYINIRHIFPKNAYLVICFTVFIIYVLCLTFNIINEIKNTSKIQKFYKNKLNIEDKELQYLKWNQIVEKIIKIYNDPNLNIYTINSKILKKENILVFLFKNNRNYLPHCSRLLEWNLIFCLIDPLFNQQAEIDDLTLIKDNLKLKIQTRCKIVFFINLLSLPFTIYIVLIYFIIKYGEIFYHNPEDAMNKNWSTKGFWKLRYYNEMKDEYNKRNYLIKQSFTEINNYYSSLETKEIILRFINFVLGSFFVLFVILSFLNETLLTDGIIFANRTTLWVMTVMGGILTINKKFINMSSQKKHKYYLLEQDLFSKLKETVPIINPSYFEYKNRYKLKKLINSLYFTKIYYLYLEFTYILLSPYYIYLMYKNIDDYINLVLDNLNKHYILGYTINTSILTDINNMNNIPHCYFSYVNFTKSNPEWKNTISEFNLMTNSINKDNFKWDNSNIEYNSFNTLQSFQRNIPNN